MPDRPIIFSALMVRALLEGRKTQTRRMLKMSGRRPDFLGPRGCEADPTCWGWETAEGYFITVEGDEKDHAPGWRNGWQDWRGAYAPGDRLWVREGFSYETLDVDRNGLMPPWYWADGNPSSGDFTRPKPPIHMPRWASRITLTVTDVRVQRLWEITELEARAEGAKPDRGGGGYSGMYGRLGLDPQAYSRGFKSLWTSIHGLGAWDANPWVAAITFTVRKGNIDHE